MIIAIKRPVVVAKRDWPKLTADQFQQVFNEQTKLAYGPVMIAATGILRSTFRRCLPAAEPDPAYRSRSQPVPCRLL
jgi:hypothetical protein